MDLIEKYFPDLSSTQEEQFEKMGSLYKDWNEKINVISRKDIDSIYLHHILHSLAIAKWTSFVPGTKIMDVGTGGGFPGIPMAVIFPEVEFLLVDSIGKKINVVNEVANELGLKNVRTQKNRMEEIVGEKADFITARAVAPIRDLVGWTRKNISQKHKNIYPNGFIFLKGGDLKQEIKEMQKGEYVEKIGITKLIKEEWFDEKFIVYVQG
jgi:16S rRNA (guanine527-N7)-methyltransferase